MSGRTVLVTGATDGLGRALALDLARREERVLLHGRDDARGAAVAEEIRAGTGQEPGWYRADLSDLAQVRSLADAVAADHPRLDVLVSNAGIGADVPGGGVRQESADGHELRFAVNHLAGFLLTRRLLPRLRAAATDRPSRIVHVSSAGQRAIDFDDVMLRRNYSGWRAYCQSKLAQVLSTVDLAEELAGQGDGTVTVTALHPATLMPTKIVPSPTSEIAEGVEATARLVLDPALDGVTGRYFHGLREARADEQAYDADARRRLRELCRDLTGA